MAETQTPTRRSKARAVAGFPAGVALVLLGWAGEALLFRGSPSGERALWVTAARSGLLALPFLAAGYLLLRRLRTGVAHPWLALLLGALGTWAALFGLLVALLGYPVAYYLGGRRGFDARAWKAEAGAMDRDNPRWLMRREAMDRLRAGMSYADVEALLGPPEERREAPREWLYNLGMWSGLRMDYDFLHVGFDDAGRMTTARIRQH